MVQRGRMDVLRRNTIESSVFDDFVRRGLIPKAGSLSSVQLDGGAAPPHQKQLSLTRP